jgi:crotonobetainyl-CoA:carnitine CoA-transferase CaiB-like acyl-CoA transferase
LLSPYRILDLTDERGHLAGYMLAALGAEVIKVEPPGGSGARRRGPFTDDGESLSFAAYDRGKRSVILDLETEQGATSLRRLATGADVLIESAEPGHMASLGLGPDDLAALNPALVYASVTPFGQDGPKASWLATDLTLMASACPLAHQGDADRAPVRVSVPQAFHFGAAAAAGGVVIALLERSHSGRGQHLDVAAQQVIPIATQGGILADLVNAPIPQRSAGGAKVGMIDLRLVYPAADGHVSITHVFGESIGPVTARLMDWVHQEGFCSAEIAGKDWVDYPVLLETGEEPIEDFETAKAAVAAFTASKPKAELLAGAMERRLLLAPISDAAEVLASEQLAARSYFHDLRLATGHTITAPGPFAQPSGTPLRLLDQVPAIGEHTDEVLAEPQRSPALGGPALAAAPAGSGGNDADDDGSGPGGAGASGALAGLKVLDFMWSLAGPFTTRALADHGATVVKIESVHKIDAARGFMPLWNNEAGAENSALFDTTNAGKRSLALDLSTPGARDVVRDLVRWADVVTETFSPRAMKAWGLDYDELRKINPKLIMFSSNLTGQYGPLATFAGYGNLGAALAGFYGLAGWPDRAPSGPFGAYTDYTSTHFMLATIAAAVDHRRRTGEGQHIDLAQAEAAMHFLAPALLDCSATGRVATRLGNADPEMAPHGIFPCRGEDRWIAIACATDDQWPALARHLGLAALADDPGLATAAGRLARGDELDAAIAAVTSGRDETELMEELQAVGVPAHRVQNSPECVTDPQLLHRGHFVEIPHAERRSIVEDCRFRLTRTPGHPSGPAPTLGEHTFEVLTELLGYDGDRIADLAAAEVLE